MGTVDRSTVTGDRDPDLRYTRRVGYGVTVEREERLMRKAIEPETFAALVETGTAREFLTLYSNERGQLIADMSRPERCGIGVR